MRLRFILIAAATFHCFYFPLFFSFFKGYVAAASSEQLYVQQDPSAAGGGVGPKANGNPANANTGACEYKSRRANCLEDDSLASG